MSFCPLVFEPIYRPKVWGGRHLARLLNKPLPSPDDQPIGESWEVVDLPDAQSIVARGPMKGRTLHSLVDEWGADLLGRAPLAAGRFPLLIKFLDACQPLSIQVHPDDATAARAGLAPIGKHEAWYVIEARDDATIYRGLRPGVSRDRAAEQLARDPASLVDCVATRRARPGDAFYLPAGTVHAAGGGLVLAEVQTPCDVTYRLYDWDRTRPAGDAGMHIREGIDAIVTNSDFAAAEKRTHVTSIFTTVTRLISCPKFRMEKVRFVEGVEQEIPYAELVCWIVLEGRGEIVSGSASERFAAGDVVVLPAALRKARLKTHAACTWLEVTVPVESDLARFDRPAAGVLRETPAADGFVSLGIRRTGPGNQP
ncbi:MAG: mannose-6-phosphate isomerase [Phycisphaerae bacterium]|nr:MAG: class I mannose-6-phosphate isomerase [Planctomycetia bacterium]RIK66605.1 MAG: hypothetical protein DCC66_12950 [Planctomycetota bacterium]GJQ27370.1 MAG: mannose-6-phosphate isomerase [Phycisphaerae bacterium]